ncbi:MAG: hypothetical protein AAGG09_14145 [Pseudomonadota bacterium]
MTTITTRPLHAAGAALGALLLASGCAYEAGSQLATADFGNSTMNNHLVQTCQAGVHSDGKYHSKAGGCPGRTWDGQYARVTYDGYIADAVPLPRVTTRLD